jgi:hypothetical protein
LIALLVLELVPASQLVRVLERELVRELVRELALVLQPEQERALQPEQVQELRLVRELVQHLPHQQLQSRFQQQRSRLLQHEFLSTLQQLAKVLRYQLCL